MSEHCCWPMLKKIWCENGWTLIVFIFTAFVVKLRKLSFHYEKVKTRGMNNSYRLCKQGNMQYIWNGLISYTLHLTKDHLWLASQVTGEWAALDAPAVAGLTVRIGLERRPLRDHPRCSMSEPFLFSRNSCHWGTCTRLSSAPGSIFRTPCSSSATWRGCLRVLRSPRTRRPWPTSCRTSSKC